MEKTVVCLKWGAPKSDAPNAPNALPYDAEWINRLYRGVARNLTPPFRFIAFTDETKGLDPAIEARDIEDLTFASPVRYFWWKLSLLHPDAGLSGRCLFLDLDNIIVGNLDDLFDYPGEFCVIRNWISRRKHLLRPRPVIFNSSVYRFEAGAHPEGVEKLLENPARADDRRLYSASQIFMTEAMGPESATWWPKPWVLSYKYDLRPPFPLNWLVRPRIPQDARVLCLTGYPKPHEAIAEGARSSWHRRMLPMPELAKHWK